MKTSKPKKPTMVQLEMTIDEARLLQCLLSAALQFRHQTSSIDRFNDGEGMWDLATVADNLHHAMDIAFDKELS